MSQDPSIAYVLIVDLLGPPQGSPPSHTEMVQLLNRLMPRCETYRRLKKRRKVIAAPSGAGYALAFFDEIGAPLRCGHELAELMVKQGSYTPRMVAHVGPVEIRVDEYGKKCIIGEGASLAAQLLELSKVGETVVTQRIYELARGLTEFVDRFEPMDDDVTKPGPEGRLYRVLGPSSGSDLPPLDLIKAEFIHKCALAKGEGKVAHVVMIARRLGRIRRDILTALLLFLVMEVIHLGVEQFSLAKMLKVWAYGQLQGFMPGPQAPSPVVVVSLGKEFVKKGRTDPEALAKLLDVIERTSPLQGGPQAIGIDIQFDNVEGRDEGVPDSVDPSNAVYQKIQALRAHSPPIMTFVGVANPVSTAPEQVFNRDTRGEAATAAEHVSHVWAPGGDSHMRSRLFGELRFVEKGGKSVERLRIRSLAGDVVRAASGTTGKPYSPHSGPIFQRTSTKTVFEDDESVQKGEQGLTVIAEEFGLNYGGLEAFERETIRVASPLMSPEEEVAFAKRIDGKMVFIGRTDDSDDKHFVPGRNRAVAGVYLQAIAAFTLGVSPIYTFLFLPGLVFGASMSLVVLLAGAGLRRHLIAAPEEVSDERLRRNLSFVLVGLICVSAIVMLKWWGILWEEFPLVALALLLDPVFEPKIHHFGEAISQWAKDPRKKRI